MCIERIQNYIANQVNNNDYVYYSIVTIATTLITTIFYKALKQLTNQCCYKNHQRIKQQVTQKTRGTTNEDKSTTNTTQNDKIKTTQIAKEEEVEGEEESDNKEEIWQASTITEAIQELNEIKRKQTPAGYGLIRLSLANSEDEQKLINILNFVNESMQKERLNKNDFIDLFVYLNKLAKSKIFSLKNSFNNYKSVYQAYNTTFCNLILNNQLESFDELTQKDRITHFYLLKYCKNNPVINQQNPNYTHFMSKLEKMITDTVMSFIREEYNKKIENSAYDHSIIFKILHLPTLKWVFKSNLSREEKNWAFMQYFHFYQNDPKPLVAFFSLPDCTKIASSIFNILTLENLLTLQKTLLTWNKILPEKNPFIITWKCNYQDGITTNPFPLISNKICEQIRQREMPLNMQNRVQAVLDETEKIFLPEQLLLQTIQSIKRQLPSGRREQHNFIDNNDTKKSRPGIYKHANDQMLQKIII